ncbi:ATP-binding cassette domain-containing protein [Micromonospora sp. STR1s_5]|nr:ATP-binding cassette domain-containing protein [Micromonospora sp. STR1s_5]
MSTQPLMEVREVSRHFLLSEGLFRPKRRLNAVDGVSLSIGRGEVLGIVGESGCGKSTLAKMLVGLLPPSAGEIRLEGTSVAGLDRRVLARRVQPVFQDPYSSLNPRRTVAQILQLPLATHKIGSARDRPRRIAAIMDRVGLATRLLHAYPNQLSGGQRQRVAIARALLVEPEILVCDEPTSALDMSVQAQILNLLTELRRTLDLTLVLISHNLAVVEHLATRVAVMYLGKVVEEADVDSVFRLPRHPYTRALLASALSPDPDAGLPDINLGLGTPADLSAPAACSFHPRCPLAIDVCVRIEPHLLPHGTNKAACHRADEVETLREVIPA